jgi:hypothetical protein
MSSAAGHSGQQFVAATVHLGGSVQIETGHRAHYTAEHVQARIGGVLVYFLDLAAVDAFAAAVAATARYGRAAFAHPHATRLPPDLVTAAQEVSLVVRLKGDQATARPRGAVATAATGMRGRVECTVGGLRLVLHDAEALSRLVHVTDTVARVAAALWPAASLDEVEARDPHAERWERENAPR